MRRMAEARFEADRADGADWCVLGATLRERLNEPYVLHVDVSSDRPQAQAVELLGSGCALDIVRRTTGLRVAGVITSVREIVHADEAVHASLTVEPALAALRHRVDSRIYQGLTVPAILERVLAEDLGPFGRSVELRLSRSYPEREYTVQYRETDFDFVHRLMEEEGIGYHFEHDGGAERLVLFDAPAHAEPIDAETDAVLPYVRRLDAELESSEGIAAFDSVARVRTNRVVTRHFDWTHPTVPIVASADASDGAWPPLESYVHDGPLTFHAFDHVYGAHDGAEQLRLHAERARRDAFTCEGEGSSLALRAGRRFTLAGHPRAERDGDYLVVTTEHVFESRVANGQPSYVTRIGCLPADVPWRPERVRARPSIAGVQTATVVGPVGEEIHTDPHGRVKVHFHWDRLGARDDHDSCWIRVVQAMGGPGWGFSFIPRIGMEVVVTFVEGNPDQPLVTGVVYNGANPTVYELPADKTRTTIRSSSSPGGQGFNELRFEDRAGSEEIWLHGEKDWNTLIKNDHTRRVGNCEAQEVVVDRTRAVGRDERVTVGGSRDKRVEVDESYHVGNDRTRVVQNRETIRIGADRAKTIGANETVEIAKNASQSVGENLTQKIAMNALQTVGMNLVQNVMLSATRNVVMDDTTLVGGSGTREIGKSLKEKVGEDLSQKVKGALDASVGKTRTVTVTLLDQLTALARNESIGTVSGEQVGVSKSIVAGESISLTCGEASLVLAKDGTITLKGTKVVIDGGTEVDVDADVINLN
ncbi:MAG: type VI secretion system Vgr family protein [Sandaracinaceae bacterium]